MFKKPAKRFLLKISTPKGCCMNVQVSAVTGAILPLFLILLLGVFIRKAGVIDWQTTKKLSSLLVNVTQPFLIIASFQTKITSDKVLIALNIVAASVIMHVAFSFLAGLIFKKSHKSDKATLEFGLIFANCAYLGYPVLAAVFPQSGLFYGALFSLVFNIYIRIYGIFLLNKGKKEKHAIRKAFINSGTVASAIGIFMFAASIRLPAVIFDTLTSVGSLTFPLSMIIVGSLLCNQPFKNLFAKKLYTFSLAKLILLPLLTLTVCAIFRVDKGLTYICVIMASMPTAANTAIFSELYKANSPLAASLVSVSSLFSVLTIPTMLALTDLVTTLFGN